MLELLKNGNEGFLERHLQEKKRLEMLLSEEVQKAQVEPRLSSTFMHSSAIGLLSETTFNK